MDNLRIRKKYRESILKGGMGNKVEEMKNALKRKSHNGSKIISRYNIDAPKKDLSEVPKHTLEIMQAAAEKAESWK